MEYAYIVVVSQQSMKGNNMCYAIITWYSGNKQESAECVSNKEIQDVISELITNAIDFEVKFYS